MPLLHLQMLWQLVPLKPMSHILLWKLHSFPPAAYNAQHPDVPLKAEPEPPRRALELVPTQHEVVADRWYKGDLPFLRKILPGNLLFAEILLHVRESLCQMRQQFLRHSPRKWVQFFVRQLQPSHPVEEARRSL